MPPLQRNNRSPASRRARPVKGTHESQESRREIRVAIADDHALFRESLRKLLESQADLHVVGEAGDGEQAIQLARTLRPDILLLDIRMPLTRGLDALGEIARTAPAIRTLLLTVEVSGPDILDALQRGARGIVLKHAASEQLFKSIRAVMAGQYWVSRACVAALIDRMRERQMTEGRLVAGSAFGLTPRELEMVAAVAEGHSNGEIAEQLGISAKTVKHHLTNIFDKLRLSNRLELALFAVQHQVDGSRFH